jgi:hypothetical protein
MRRRAHRNRVEVEEPVAVRWRAFAFMGAVSSAPPMLRSIEVGFCWLPANDSSGPAIPSTPGGAASFMRAGPEASPRGGAQHGGTSAFGFLAGDDPPGAASHIAGCTPAGRCTGSQNGSEYFGTTKIIGLRDNQGGLSRVQRSSRQLAVAFCPRGPRAGDRAGGGPGAGLEHMVERASIMPIGTGEPRHCLLDSCHQPVHGSRCACAAATSRRV